MLQSFPPNAHLLRTVEEKNESGQTTLTHQSSLFLPTLAPTSSRKGRRVVVSTRNDLP
jgi:hypothetical protein